MIITLSANAGDMGDVDLIPGLGRSPWRRAWKPTPVFLPGKSRGQRSLVGYSPGSCKDLTELLNTHIHTGFGFIQRDSRLIDTTVLQI